MLGRPRLTAAAAGLCPRPPPSSPAVPYLRWRRGVVRRPAGLPLPRRHVRGARPEVSLPAVRGGGWSPSCSTSRRFGRRSRPLGRVTVGRGGALLLPLFQSPRAAVSLAASVLESRRSGRRSRPLVRTLVAASCCLLRWVSVVVWSPDGPSATLPLCSCGGDADPSDASWEALPGESLWTSAPCGYRAPLWRSPLCVMFSRRCSGRNPRSLPSHGSGDGVALVSFFLLGGITLEPGLPRMALPLASPLADPAKILRWGTQYDWGISYISSSISDRKSVV